MADYPEEGLKNINNSDAIAIKMRETDLGFRRCLPRTPSDVLEVLLEVISEDGDAEQYSSLKKNRQALEKSITGYHIEVGETGSSGEDDCLWDEYREYISENYENEDDLDCAMEEAYDSGEWVTKVTTFDFKQGDAAASSSVSMTGPAD